jgi:hypothetical protein
MNPPGHPARKPVPNKPAAKRPVAPASPKLTASDKRRVNVLFILAGAFVALIVLGFVIPVGNVSLWKKVGQVITGTAPEGGGRVQQNYVIELQSTDEYLASLKDDLAAYTEDAKSTDPAKLKQTRMFVKTSADTIAGSIKNCEGYAQKLKDGKWDKPTPAEFNERAKKLAEYAAKFKALLDQLDAALK